jgi:hypothetical protein
MRRFCGHLSVHCRMRWSIRDPPADSKSQASDSIQTFPPALSKGEREEAQSWNLNAYAP